MRKSKVHVDFARWNLTIEYFDYLFRLRSLALSLSHFSPSRPLTSGWLSIYALIPAIIMLMVLTHSLASLLLSIARLRRLLRLSYLINSSSFLFVPYKGVYLMRKSKVHVDSAFTVIESSAANVPYRI